MHFRMITLNMFTSLLLNAELTLRRNRGCICYGCARGADAAAVSTGEAGLAGHCNGCNKWLWQVSLTAAIQPETGLVT